LSIKLLKLKCENGGGGDGDGASDVVSYQERLDEHEQMNELLLKNFRIGNLRQLLKFFGEEYFHLIAYHTLIGNQVILRGRYENMVSSIIRTLEELLPLGCCKSVYYSNEYLKSYQCRLLGVSSEVKSPFHSNNSYSYNESDKKSVFDFDFSPSLDPNSTTTTTTTTTKTQAISELNDYLFVDIIIKPKDANSAGLSSRKSSERSETPAKSLQDKSLNLDYWHAFLNQMTSKTPATSTPHFSYFFDRIDQENFFNINVQTNLSQHQLNQDPKILTKIEAYLMNESLDIHSVNLLIKLAKEEWLNKTKVLYKLFNQSSRVKNSIDLETVLKMLDLTKADELAIKFWQAGLSDECKSQIRAT
jgi:hypothetical protein